MTILLHDYWFGCCSWSGSGDLWLIGSRQCRACEGFEGECRSNYSCDIPILNNYRSLLILSGVVRSVSRALFYYKDREEEERKERKGEIAGCY